jgi:hypothetical protein
VCWQVRQQLRQQLLQVRLLPLQNLLLHLLLLLLLEQRSLLLLPCQRAVPTHVLSKQHPVLHTPSHVLLQGQLLHHGLPQAKA